MIWNICIILGTRPEVVKMSHVVRACERQGADWFMIHAGQDCSCDVGLMFSEGVGLPDVKYNLDVGYRIKGADRDDDRGYMHGKSSNFRVFSNKTGCQVGIS